MDHLSSCYFCGTALDDPLQNYRVVPGELRDDDDVTTATLCSSCHGKLERLLGPVVEAAGGGGATLDPDRSERDDGETTAETDAPDERSSPPDDEGLTASEDDGGLVDVDTGLIDVDDGDDVRETPEPVGTEEPAEPSGVADLPEDADPFAGEGDKGSELGTDDEGSESVTDDGPEEAMEPDSPDELQAEDTTGTASNDDEPAGAGTKRDENATHGDRDGGSDERADEGGDDADADRSKTDTATRTTISALEYNKVMRLLQNREFPVDRVKIEAVAANAYGLGEHECAEVIDLAIDRGLIDEQNGQLVRSE